MRPSILIVAIRFNFDAFRSSLPTTRENDWADMPAWAEARALSQLNFRVDRREFAAGVVDLHLPVDAALGAVDVG